MNYPRTVAIGLRLAYERNSKVEEVYITVL
jgi:hypothetical protein